PEQLLMIHIIDQALRDAGVADDDPIRERADVILGRGGYILYRMAEMCLHVEMIPRLVASLRVCFPHLPAHEIDAYAAQIQSMMTPPEADTLSSMIPNLVASRSANR